MNKRKSLRSALCAIFLIAFCAIGMLCLSGCGECEEHTFRIEPRTATCEDAGLVFRFCEACGYNDEVESPALGHDYYDWKIQTEATCQHVGKRTRYCPQCHTEEEEEIPMLPHTTETWRVKTNPTETEIGVAEGDCSVCGHRCTADLPTLNETDYKVDVIDSESKTYTYTIDNSEVQVYVSSYEFFEYYGYEGGTAYRIRAKKEITTEKLVLPSTYNGYPVVTIMDGGFFGSHIKEIVIPEGIEIIEPNAFEGCENLEKITLPSTIKSIGKSIISYESGSSAFSLIKDIYYNGTIENWCNIEFDNYTNPMGLMSDDGNFYILNENKEYDLLTEVTFPDSITSIPKQQFYNLKSLKKVNLNNNVTSIGAEAFALTGLTSIVIPNSVTSIGDFAFYRSELAEVSLPNGMKTIPYGMFSNCKNLESITIPSSVTHIDADAFYECENLATVEIKTDSQLAKISKHAFYDCYKITSLVLPATLEYVGSYAIPGTCATIYYMGNANAFDYIEGKNFLKFSDSTIYYYSEDIPRDTTNEYWYVNDSNEIAIWVKGTFAAGKQFVYSHTKTTVTDQYWGMLKAAEAQGILEMLFPSSELGEEMAKRQIEMVTSSQTKAEYEEKLCEFSSEAGQNSSYKFEDGKVTVSINGQVNLPMDYVEFDNVIYVAGRPLCYIDTETNCIYELNETEYNTVWHYYEIVSNEQ